MDGKLTCTGIFVVIKPSHLGAHLEKREEGGRGLKHTQKKPSDPRPTLARPVSFGGSDQNRTSFKWTTILVRQMKRRKKKKRNRFQQTITEYSALLPYFRARQGWLSQFLLSVYYARTFRSPVPLLLASVRRRRCRHPGIVQPPL